MYDSATNTRMTDAEDQLIMNYMYYELHNTINCMNVINVQHSVSNKETHSKEFSMKYSLILILVIILCHYHDQLGQSRYH